MRIRKIGQVTPSRGSIVDSYNTSTTDGYSANYINNHSVVVSSTEPTTKSKVWLQKTKNLFNKNNVTTGKSISSSTGNTYTDSNSFSTDYIDISNIRNIAWNGYSNTGTSTWGALYDSNKTFLEGVSESSAQTIEITNTNAKYLRLGFLNTYLDTLMIVSDTNTPTSYEPYVQDKTYILNNNVYEEFAPQNEIYSTNEIRIGTYKGKPLYRRVVDYSVSADWQTVATTNNVDEYVTIQSTAKTSYVIPFYLNSTSYAYFYVSSNKQNVILASAGLTGNSFSVILEYTKTTDD